jgi:hypothetical protein
MFPHACGEAFEQAVAAGGDPEAVVPDDYVVVKGGTLPLPQAGSGEAFSGAVGPTLTDAAAAVPHGQIRATTAGAIRSAGGTVTWAPEKSRRHTLNRQHVNIVEGNTSTFSELTRNPVPLRDRIDGQQP